MLTWIDLTFKTMAGSLEAIRYAHAPGGGASLRLLEQRLLPLETLWLDIAGPTEAWGAIRDMTVRGAPAIGECAPPPPPPLPAPPPVPATGRLRCAIP